MPRCNLSKIFLFSAFVAVTAMTFPSVARAGDLRVDAARMVDGTGALDSGYRVRDVPREVWEISPGFDGRLENYPVLVTTLRHFCFFHVIRTSEYTYQNSTYCRQ